MALTKHRRPKCPIGRLVEVLARLKAPPYLYRGIEVVGPCFRGDKATGGERLVVVLVVRYMNHKINCDSQE